MMLKMLLSEILLLLKGLKFINFSHLKSDLLDEVNGEWYALRPNTDTAIMLGIAHTLHVEKLSDKEFLQSHTEGFDQFLEYLLGKNDGVEKDADWAAELICSPKDHAENIMIVDLLRNDLGKVCQSGSIKVPHLLVLESYSQVHHLTSVVKGILNTNKTWVDLLQACWPGGSVTGAPKLRACKRLYELEPTARGPYCGSILNINWDGVLDSNILIRSLMIKESSITAHAGCGIVADSDSQKEAEEMNWKLMPLLNALT